MPFIAQAPGRIPMQTIMRVLVVDDDPGTRETLFRLIETRGFLVTLAHGVLDAVRQLDLFCFKLVLTDFHMRDGTGEAVVQASLQRSPLTPIVIMTGDVSTVPIHVRNLIHGLFQKPDIFFQLDELLAIGLPHSAG